jgi:hypothetical protein
LVCNTWERKGRTKLRKRKRVLESWVPRVPDRGMAESK